SAKLEQPICSFGVQCAIAIPGLSPVDGHQKKVPAVLGDTIGCAWLYLVYKAVRVREDSCCAEIHTVGDYRVITGDGVIDACCVRSRRTIVKNDLRLVVCTKQNSSVPWVCGIRSGLRRNHDPRRDLQAIDLAR